MTSRMAGADVKTARHRARRDGTENTEKNAMAHSVANPLCALCCLLYAAIFMAPSAHREHTLVIWLDFGIEIAHFAPYPVLALTCVKSAKTLANSAPMSGWRPLDCAR